MKLDIVLVLIAAAINILGSQIYIWTIVLHGAIQPNITSWFLWALISTLNFTSYKAMSKDWLKSALATISSLQCILTFVLTLFFGKLGSIGGFDYSVIALGTATAVIWWKWQSATLANVILQVAIMIGFIPTFVATWSHPAAEPPLPWFLWASSFIVQSIAVKMRLKRWQELAYPINGIWLHGVVWMLAVR